jgi:hypothetical protein
MPSCVQMPSCVLIIFLFFSGIVFSYVLSRVHVLVLVVSFKDFFSCFIPFHQCSLPVPLSNFNLTVY